MFLFGAALPILVELSLYARAGELRLLWDANIASSLRRAQIDTSDTSFARNYVWLFRQFWTLAPQVYLGCFGLLARANRARAICVLWLAASLLAIVLAREFYERQFVLLTAPIALIGSLGFVYVLRIQKRPRLRRMTAVSVLALTYGLHDYYESTQSIAYTWHRIILRDGSWRLDQFSEVDSAVACLAPLGSSIYLIEQSPYLYDVLGVPSPTAFPYSDHLLDPRLSTTAGINGKAELERIFSHKPDFVVVSNLRDFRYAKERVELIKDRLSTNYIREYQTREFSVFRRASFAIHRFYAQQNLSNLCTS